MKQETIEKINEITAHLKKIEAAVAHWLDEYTEPDWLTLPPPEGFVDLGVGPVKVHEGDEICWIDVDLGRWSPPSTLNTGEFPNSRYAAKIGSVTAALNGKGPCKIYGYTEEGEEITPPEGWEIVPKGEPLKEGDKPWSQDCQWAYTTMLTGYTAERFGGIRAYARRKQPKTVPLDVEDWAGGPWWVKLDNRVMAHAVTSVCITDGDVFFDSRWFEAAELAEEWQRSKDLINWEPCKKEAK